MWFKVSSFHNGKSSINKLIINLTEKNERCLKAEMPGTQTKSEEILSSIRSWGT